MTIKFCPHCGAHISVAGLPLPATCHECGRIIGKLEIMPLVSALKAFVCAGTEREVDRAREMADNALATCANWWMENFATGAQYDAVDTDTGFAFEQVSRGDDE
jgi:hypothetical protein